MDPAVLSHQQFGVLRSGKFGGLSVARIYTVEFVQEVESEIESVWFT